MATRRTGTPGRRLRDAGTPLPGGLKLEGTRSAAVQAQNPAGHGTMPLPLHTRRRHLGGL